MKKEQRLIKCLDEILDGRTTLEECSLKYPRLAGELADLHKIAAGVTAAGSLPSDDFKKRAAAALAGEMRTTAAETRKSDPHWLSHLFSPRSLAFRLIAGILVIALSGGGTVYASRDSLPGETLYPVKRGVENARLALAFTPESKAGLYLERVQERSEETVRAASQNGSRGAYALENVPEDIDRAVRQIASTTQDREQLLQRLMKITDNGQKNLAPLFAAFSAGDTSTLEQSLDALRRGYLIGEISYRNPAFLATLPTVNDETIESRVFTLRGTLLEIDDDDWNVGGVSLANVNRPSGLPEIGAGLQLKGIVSANATFIWNLEPGPDEGGKTIIEGILSEKSEGSSITCVGGLELHDIASLQQTPVGTFLRIVGTVVEGRFYSDEDRDEEGAGPGAYEQDGARNEGPAGVDKSDSEEDDVRQSYEGPGDSGAGSSLETTASGEQLESPHHGDHEGHKVLVSIDGNDSHENTGKNNRSND
ncbi:MAG: hypothetical protein A2Y92_02665 [Chloroflexi bacterium RBG_13_57_8]|nr:MAG: hypothetical protein A2Y92_02665 [Chloroflexi bacterium RBG_13_57_8]